MFTYSTLMLNFENVGSPVAKITSKDAKDQIVYLADPEFHEVRHPYTQIDLKMNTMIVNLKKYH